MTLEDESPDILLEAGADVRHIHFARVEERTFPAEIEAGYRTFFANLRAYRLRWPRQCGGVFEQTLPVTTPRSRWRC